MKYICRLLLYYYGIEKKDHRFIVSIENFIFLVVVQKNYQNHMVLLSMFFIMIRLHPFNFFVTHQTYTQNYPNVSIKIGFVSLHSTYY